MNEITDEELEKAANFEAAISDDQMYELEEAANDKSRGQQRRLVLVACSRSAEKLSDLSTLCPDAFIEMKESIEAYREHAKGLLEMADSASFRMTIADCRPGQVKG